MGNSLDTPTVEKESACSVATGELRLAWASSSMQGWRKSMEDAHICTPSFNEGAAAARADAWRGLGLFGVFDGHGGEQVAKFCRRHFQEELCTFPLERSKSSRRKDLSQALRACFHRMDDMLREDRYIDELNKLSNLPASQKNAAFSRPMLNAEDVGCTACVCCLTATEIIVANAGDSRAVLCSGGQAVPLSFDHKPNDQIERDRIYAAGGTVQNMGQGVYRVCGNLNLSRAIGDLKFKQGRLPPEEQMICSTPDVHIQDRSEQDEFVVICCDGVWDVMTNEEVVAFVRQRLPKGRQIFPKDLERTMEALMDKCLSPDLRTTNGLGGDNMTAVIVLLGSEVLPRLSSVLPSDASRRDGGELEATIDFPVGSAMKDVFFNLAEGSTLLHVGLMHRPVSQGGNGSPSTCLDLAAHVPEGAKFVADGVVAKFHPKEAQLRVLLPWKL